MERIYFNLYQQFPNFCNKFDKFEMPFDEQMRKQGFKSALYHPASEIPPSNHSLLEEEYTWFALRYG